MTKKLLHDEFNAPAPIGRLTVIADGEKLVHLAFGAWDSTEMLAALAIRFGGAMLAPAPGLLDMNARLKGYFEGDSTAFDGLAFDAGGTDFQQKVWRGLRAIPHGETRSYKELAAAVGQPNAARAVGTANGKNPIPIVIPCHRVIDSDGSLGGYGGGLQRKEWLLRHEGAF